MSTPDRTPKTLPKRYRQTKRVTIKEGEEDVVVDNQVYNNTIPPFLSKDEADIYTNPLVKHERVVRGSFRRDRRRFQGRKDGTNTNNEADEIKDAPDYEKQRYKHVQIVDKGGEPTVEEGKDDGDNTRRGKSNIIKDIIDGTFTDELKEDLEKIIKSERERLSTIDDDTISVETDRSNERVRKWIRDQHERMGNELFENKEEKKDISDFVDRAEERLRPFRIDDDITIEELIEQNKDRWIDFTNEDIEIEEEERIPPLSTGSVSQSGINPQTNKIIDLLEEIVGSLKEKDSIVDQTSIVYLNFILNDSATLQLPHQITNIKSIKLTNIELPFSYNVIRENVNNQFTIVYDDGAFIKTPSIRDIHKTKATYTPTPILIVIPAGNYTANEIVDEINEQIDAATLPEDVEMSFNDSTGLFTLSIDEDIPVGTLQFSGDTTLATFLNFKTDAATFTSRTTISKTNLSGQNSLYIRSNALTTGSIDGYAYENRKGVTEIGNLVPNLTPTVEGSNILLKMPIFMNSSFIIFDKPSVTLNFERSLRKTLQTIDLTLTNPATDEIISIQPHNIPFADIPNPLNWSISFEIEKWAY